MRVSCLRFTVRGTPDRIHTGGRHLKSYEHMGMFNVTCSDGCSCEEATIDSWHKAINSQVGDCNDHGDRVRLAAILVECNVRPLTTAAQGAGCRFASVHPRVCKDIWRAQDQFIKSSHAMDSFPKLALETCRLVAW